MTQKKSDSNNFLEIKNCSYSALSLGGTWNDTTIEKAKAFQTDNVLTALGIWRGATDLLCVIYGIDRGVGKYLEEKVLYFKQGKTVRSTQSIGAVRMLKEFGFSIELGSGYSKPDVARLMIAKSGGFKKYFE